MKYLTLLFCLPLIVRSYIRYGTPGGTEINFCLNVPVIKHNRVCLKLKKQAIVRVQSLFDNKSAVCSKRTLWLTVWLFPLQISLSYAGDSTAGITRSSLDVGFSWNILSSGSCLCNGIKTCPGGSLDVTVTCSRPDVVNVTFTGNQSGTPVNDRLLLEITSC